MKDVGATSKYWMLSLYNFKSNNSKGNVESVHTVIIGSQVTPSYFLTTEKAETERKVICV